MEELAVGECRMISVCARKIWNHSGLLLTPGQEYELAVDPESVADWQDGNLAPTDPAGNMPRRHRLWPWLRRYRQANWYALVGSVGQSPESYFSIGWATSHMPETMGEFLCFANDLRVTYWNNKGSLALRVTRRR